MDCNSPKWLPTGCMHIAGKPGATTSYTENNTVDPVEPKKGAIQLLHSGQRGRGSHHPRRQASCLQAPQ